MRPRSDQECYKEYHGAIVTANMCDQRRKDQEWCSGVHVTTRVLQVRPRCSREWGPSKAAHPGGRVKSSPFSVHPDLIAISHFHIIRIPPLLLLRLRTRNQILRTTATKNSQHSNKTAKTRQNTQCRHNLDTAMPATRLARKRTELHPTPRNPSGNPRAPDPNPRNPKNYDTHTGSKFPPPPKLRRKKTRRPPPTPANRTPARWAA